MLPSDRSVIQNREPISQWAPGREARTAASFPCPPAMPISPKPLNLSRDGIHPAHEARTEASRRPRSERGRADAGLAQAEAAGEPSASFVEEKDWPALLAAFIPTLDCPDHFRGAGSLQSAGSAVARAPERQMFAAIQSFSRLLGSAPTCVAAG
jgi:hypothetical protein